MKNLCELDPIFGQLYLAGERVPPGVYRQITSLRIVVLDCEDYLPASLDGTVACYHVIRCVCLDGAPGDSPEHSKRSE